MKVNDSNNFSINRVKQKDTTAVLKEIVSQVNPSEVSEVNVEEQTTMELDYLNPKYENQIEWVKIPGFPTLSDCVSEYDFTYVKSNTHPLTASLARTHAGVVNWPIINTTDAVLNAIKDTAMKASFLSNVAAIEDNERPFKENIDTYDMLHHNVYTITTPPDINEVPRENVYAWVNNKVYTVKDSITKLAIAENVVQPWMAFIAKMEAIVKSGELFDARGNHQFDEINYGYVTTAMQESLGYPREILNHSVNSTYGKLNEAVTHMNAYPITHTPTADVVVMPEHVIKIGEQYVDKRTNKPYNGYSVNGVSYLNGFPQIGDDAFATTTLMAMDQAYVNTRQHPSMVPNNATREQFGAGYIDATQHIQVNAAPAYGMPQQGYGNQTQGYGAPQPDRYAYNPNGTSTQQGYGNQTQGYGNETVDRARKDMEGQAYGIPPYAHLTPADAVAKDLALDKLRIGVHPDNGNPLSPTNPYIW